MDRTVTDRRTGASETWHDVGPNGENRPVAKTLPDVTVRGNATVTRNIQPEQSIERNAASQVAEYNTEHLGNRLDGNMQRLEPRPKPTERLAHRMWRIDPQTGERILVEDTTIQPVDESIGPALSKYDDDYQNIWQRGGYRNAEERREQRMQEAIARERMRIERESNADRNAIMRIDRTKRKNDVGL